MHPRGQTFWKLVTLTLCFFPVLNRATPVHEPIAKASSAAALILAGAVSESHLVHITQSAGSSQLDLGQDGNEIEIARIIERSNYQHPYTVTVSSANGGVFKAGTKSGPAYTLTYNSKPISLNAKDAKSEAAPIATYASALHETVHVLKISFAGAKQNSDKRAPANAIAYRDTIIFSIAAM
jgi:hypothetical protein